MLYSETGLPKKLCEYLEEICSNEGRIMNVDWIF